MTRPPDEPAPELERVVDAISDGQRVEWERELAGAEQDAGTLAALRIIDEVGRAHRSGGEGSQDGA